MGSSWSGRRGSNSRPSAWKADALPIELLPHHRKFLKTNSPISKTSSKTLTPNNIWWRGKDSNLRRQCQQIYSLPRLATSVPLRCQSSAKKSNWSWQWDSNPQPADYKSAALPIELCQHTQIPFQMPLTSLVTDITT